MFPRVVVDPQDEPSFRRIAVRQKGDSTGYTLSMMHN